jgi:SEC-C motif
MSLLAWLRRLLPPIFPSQGPPPFTGEIGRQEPCWCGSGKKYKQCHLRKDSEQRVEAAFAARAAQMAARNSGKGAITPGGSKANKAPKSQEFKEWKGGGKPSS